MTLHDGFGAPVSHGNQADIDRFTKAARLLLAYAPDPQVEIEAVLANAPDFIMARCFLAGIYLMASDKRKQVQLAEQYGHLEKLLPQANERERGHIEAIKSWLDGDFYASSQAYADILLACPRDLPALQTGHQTDFLLGLASSNRDRPARVLPHWSERDEDYSFVLGMQAFGLEEAGHYPQAEECALKSVSLNPKNTWGIHAVAHCYEMRGKVDTGIAFMENCEDMWGGDNYMSIHNRWHLALYRIERCEFARALEMHDTYMTVDAKSELMDINDSAALLWRLYLDGVDVGTRWGVVADCYTAVMEQAYIPFTDMHAMMSFMATGRQKEADTLIAALQGNSQGSTTSSMVIKMAGLPIVKGIQAFGREDYDTAKRLLSSARHSAHLFGGSVAQRDIINLTLMEAAMRSGDTPMVEGLIAERTALKPHSPLTDMFASRAGI